MILEADVKYNVDAPIGSGHFGLVYRGRYKEGEVAIKILLDVEVRYICSVKSAKWRALFRMTTSGRRPVLFVQSLSKVTQMSFASLACVSSAIRWPSLPSS